MADEPTNTPGNTPQPPAGEPAGTQGPSAQPHQPMPGEQLPADPAERDELPPLTTAPVTSPVDSDQADLDQFDAANRSLADALTLSFRLLRYVIVLLLAVFIFSGFFTVRQDEVAIRTTFGRITAGPGGGDVLTAEGGPYFRWPAPIGQVYRIPTTRQTIFLDRSFVFDISARDVGRNLMEVGGSGRLDPERDGSLLTGDKNLVHARYAVTYRVRPEGAADFIRNVASVEAVERGVDDPRGIFRAANVLVVFAVEEAIVRHVASQSIDEFLGGDQTGPIDPTVPLDPIDGADFDMPADDAAENPDELDLGDPDAPVGQPSPGEEAPVDGLDAPAEPRVAREDAIRATAQQTLDRLGAGVVLEEVLRTDQSPPIAVRQAFVDVNNARQLQRTMISEGERERRSHFTEHAGPAFEAVVAVLDEYEAADRLREADPDRYRRAEEALETLFSGETMREVLVPLAQGLESDDPQRQRLLTLADRYAQERLGGRAATIVNEARAQSLQIEEQMRQEAEMFTRLLEQYREAPQLVRSRLYFEMWGRLLDNAEGQTEFLPPGLRQLLLDFNEDPQVQRELRQRQQNERRDTQPRQELAPLAPARGVGAGGAM